MKRLALLATLVLGITGMAGVMPAAADQNGPGTGNQGAVDRGAGGGGVKKVATIPLGWEAEGPAEDRLSMPLFNGTSIVPGDSGEQTVAVRNDGPVDGVLTASIANVKLGGDPADPFYDELLLNGQPVSQYQHRKTAVLKTWLDRGESTTVDLSYHFPENSVSGNDPVARMGVSFDVVLQIRETTPTAEERPGPDDGVERPGPDDDGASLPSGDGLAYTGSNLLWLVGTGLLLALLGGLLLLVRRRAASDDSAS